MVQRNDGLFFSLLFFAGLLCLSACAPGKTLKKTPGDVHIIQDVPFFPNETDQCGPAALATVLNYWKIPTTPETLRSEVYLPHLKGTLPLDMAPAIQMHGLSAEVINGSFDDIRAEIRQDRPVIAYLDFGTRSHPIGHFLVVIGYDETRKGLIVHSGPRKSRFATYKRFNRGWSDTDHWMMMVNRSTDTAPSVTKRPVPNFPNLMTADDYFQLGQTYESEGLIEEARKKYEAALKVDKNSEPALMALGNLAFNEKNLEAAEKYYRRIIKGNPDHGAANNNLAMIYLAGDKSLKKAERYAQKATESRQYRPYAYDTLAQIYLKQAEFSKAREAIHEAISAAGDDTTLIRQLKATQGQINQESPSHQAE